MYKDINMEEHCYIGGIQRFSTEDGPGIRTTIFLKGCPLNCKWCHNPELIDFEIKVMINEKKCIKCSQCIIGCPTEAISFANGGINIDEEKCINCRKCVDSCCSGALHYSGNNMDLNKLIDIVCKDRAYYANSGGGATLSGGEILAHGDYAILIVKKLIEQKISVVIETSGYGSFEKLKTLSELSEVVFFDIKHMNSEKHLFYTGKDLKIIHDNLSKLCAIDELKKKVILRVPLIHNINDTDENIEKICELMENNKLKKIQLLPYHSMGIAKAREIGITQEKFEEPSQERLNMVKTIFHKNMIDVEIMGQ